MEYGNRATLAKMPRIGLGILVSLVVASCTSLSGVDKLFIRPETSDYPDADGQGDVSDLPKEASADAGQDRERDVSTDPQHDPAADSPGDAPPGIDTDASEEDRVPDVSEDDR